MTRSFEVAGHVFSFSAPAGSSLWNDLGQYDPFVTENGEDAVFHLSLADSLPAGERTVALDQPVEDGETVIRLFHQGADWLVEMSPHNRIPIVARLWISHDFSEGRLKILFNEDTLPLFAVNNSLMLMFAFRTACMGTLEMHASVIGCGGKAFLFLAKSGTGKSTHSSLWLKHIPGSELINDDNPVVRVWPDGRVVCYGSPWSGKTPCYRKVEVPVGAFVRIRRSPENRIEKLDVFNSYASIYSSSSGFKADRRMADGLHETFEKVATTMPCYVLYCRPDEEAARICAEAVL